MGNGDTNALELCDICPILCVFSLLQPKERDRVEGGWYAYHPVGGAITVLAKDPTVQGSAAGSSSVGLPGATGAAAAKAKGRGFGIQVIGSSSNDSSSRMGKVGAQGDVQSRKLGDTALLKP